MLKGARGARSRPSTTHRSFRVWGGGGQASWLERLGNPRKDAAVRQLVSVLPEQPVIDVAAGQRLTGKSHVAVQNALKQLVDAGIINPINERRWGRAWECTELLELVEDFEEAVTSGRSS